MAPEVPSVLELGQKKLVAENFLGIAASKRAFADPKVVQRLADLGVQTRDRKEGIPLPARPFLDVVGYEFGIDNPDQHYHLPFKCTPWGLLLLQRRCLMPQENVVRP